MAAIAHRIGGWPGRIAVAAGLVFGLGQAAAAQDAAFGRGVWLSQANCSECHGWLADGNPEDPRAPKGANLRETALNAEQLIEVILCGRPSTGMPHYDQRAYADDRCYGVTAEDLGDAKPPKAPIVLTRRHATGLAAFILDEFAGRGAPTFEDCEALLGAGNPRCPTYPKAGQ